MATSRVPTYPIDGTRATGAETAASRLGGPRRSHTGQRLSIVRVDGADASAADYVLAASIGVRGIINAAWQPVADADGAYLTFSPTRVTFNGANTDCDGYLWILSAA
jgi:hypothetical protein